MRCHGFNLASDESGHFVIFRRWTASVGDVLMRAAQCTESTFPHHLVAFCSRLISAAASAVTPGFVAPRTAASLRPMTTEYAEALVTMYRESLEAEPYDEDHSVDLLFALKNESPERYEQLVQESGFHEFMDRFFPPKP
jgi:hypothetical protein